MNTKKKLWFAAAYIAIGGVRLIMAWFDSRETSVSSYAIASAFVALGIIGIIMALAHERKHRNRKIDGKG